MPEHKFSGYRTGINVDNQYPCMPSTEDLVGHDYAIILQNLVVCRACGLYCVYGRWERHQDFRPATITFSYDLAMALVALDDVMDR